MRNLSILPGIDRWGARRVEAAINVDTAGGALIGVLLTPPLLFVARFLEASIRYEFGYPWGFAGFLLGWFLSGYAALVLLANWRTIDDEPDASQDAESTAQSDAS